MIPELGYGATVVALVLAFAGAVAAAAGGATGRGALVEAAQRAAGEEGEATGWARVLAGAG